MKSNRSVKNIFQLLKQSMVGEEQDYTRISMKMGIFLLAVPMIMEMIMESLFAVVDIFFVGHLGEYAIAAVGLTEAMLMIVYSVGMGVSMAATAMVSRRFGEKNFHKAGSTSFQLLSFGAVVSIVMGLAGWYFAPQLLQLMGASPEVIEKGTTYTRIVLGGNTSIMLLFIINGMFRGAGQAHLAMRTLWISNGINIALVPFFIFGVGAIPGLGLEGAAWGTTTGRTLGVLYQLYHLFNGKHRLMILREHMKLKLKTMKKIALISSGGMGQFLIDSVAWIVLTRFMASFGSEAVAGYTIAFRIMVFSMMPAWGLSAAAATLVGQNLGAGKLRRAELSTWLTARYNFIFLAFVTLVYLLFGDYFVSLFTDNVNVVAFAAQGLRITTLGYVFFAVGMVMIQAFNGAGDTKTPMYINTGLLLCLEIPLAYLLAFTFDFKTLGIFMAIAFCHSLHAVVSVWFFKKGNWKKIAV
jgi:putative MATE family efflux protein